MPSTKVPRAQLEWLRAEAARWREAGLIDPAAEGRILGEYEAESGEGRGMMALLVLGALMLGVGVALLIGYNWDAIPRNAKVAISYTDGFSLSLGLGFPKSHNRPVLIGGFHGLSDIESRAPANARAIVHQLIRRSLAGLDHVFFFGPADRKIAIDRYRLSPEKSSVILFGVDTEFWRPMPDGRKPEPGGWNRIHFVVADLAAEVERLRAADVRFRNDIISGPGGQQIVLDDPAGNPIELFQPASS